MNPEQKRNLIKNFNSFDFLLLDINKKIYFLTILYSYFEGAIQTYYGSGLFFLGSGIDDLNDYFKILRKKIIEIIESDPSLLKIKENSAYKDTIETIDSLYTSSEFLDILWHTNILPSLINLREELNDENLFKNNCEIHTTTEGVVFFLSEISEQLDILKKVIHEKNSEFLTNKNYKDDKLESRKNTITDDLKKTSIKLPLFIGEDENIYIQGEMEPFICKCPNRTYYLIRGCIEKVNINNSVDINILFDYLKRHNSQYQERFKIDEFKKIDIWQLIRKTFNNIKSNNLPINNFISLDKTTKKYLVWKI